MTIEKALLVFWRIKHISKGLILFNTYYNAEQKIGHILLVILSYLSIILVSYTVSINSYTSITPVIIFKCCKHCTIVFCLKNN